MKRPLFNIADEEFMTLLERTKEGFDREGIDYMLVGGVATQIHVAKALCDVYEENLVDLAGSGKLRLQDHLRSTDDIDMALRIDDSDQDEKKEINVARRIYKVLDYIVGEGDFISPSGEHIVSINLVRRAHVRPQFQLGIDDAISLDKIASFNLFRGPVKLHNTALSEFEDRFYDVFIDRAMNVRLPYSKDGDIEFRVKRPEDLLATKIALGRPKDINDALSIVRHLRDANRSVDYEAVAEVLCSKDPKYHCQSENLCNRYEKFRELEGTLRD